MAGPNGELNGTSILLYAKVGLSFLLVGSQRGVKFSEKSDYLDFSSKNARERYGDYGRYSSSANLTNLYIPNASGMAAFRNAIRNGTPLTVKKYESGSPVEAADCIVTGFDLDAPDQAPAVVTCQLEVTGLWT